MLNLNKFILGSAQFSGKYGISNNRLLSTKEIDQIIRYSYQKGIKYIEVCSSYGDSQYKIIKSLKSNTLINKFNSFYKLDSVQKDTLKFIKALNDNSNLKAIFAHSTNFYLSKNFQNLIKNLNQNTIQVGVSIYEIKEINKLINSKNRLNIIQVPYNIFNKKFDEKKLIQKLSTAGIQIHVRSIFNQGLIFLSNKKFKLKFPKNYNYFQKFNNKLSEFDEKIFDISVKLPLSKKYFKKILLGISNKSQIDHLLKINKKKINKKLVKNIENLKFNNIKICDPRKW